MVVFDSKGTRCPSYNISTGISFQGNNVLRNNLKKLNLLNNKHIPHKYLVSSVEDRLELLAGIIDTDGYKARTTYEVIFKSEIFARDVTFLARSLGFSCNLKRKWARATNAPTHKGDWYWRLHISGETSTVPLRVSRKKTSKRLQKKNHLVTENGRASCRERVYDLVASQGGT